MAEITVHQGDLTRQEVDAVVNAANPSLLGGGGVDGAIHRAGGPEILAACRRIRAEQWPGGLPTGRAVATPAGRLPARFVVHTVGPVYAEHDDPAPPLRSCHVESLRVAVEVRARTVAFPAISCGVYGYPVEEAAPVAVAAVREAVVELAGRLDEVRFVLFDDAAHRAWRAALDG